MTLDPGYFRARYAASPDPYGLAERWYEARKYALTVALRDPDFTAEVYARADGDRRSVAQAGGIVPRGA